MITISQLYAHASRSENSSVSFYVYFSSMLRVFSKSNTDSSISIIIGSTAIKMSHDGTTAMPSQAIGRLKQSTQYARVLPIIGLSISSRGVEFLKHTKDRIVICFHDIKTIHCACQDQDLRYFAYVTREHRLTNGMSHASSHASTTSPVENKPQSPPSPSLTIGGDYHHYCHVFVVKSEAMSTEV